MEWPLWSANSLDAVTRAASMTPSQIRRLRKSLGMSVREFADALSGHTGIPVKMWDERLTTVEASRVLRESGIGIEKRARAVDRLSAVILLQSYLDSL